MLRSLNKINLMNDFSKKCKPNESNNSFCKENEILISIQEKISEDDD